MSKKISIFEKVLYGSGDIGLNAMYTPVSYTHLALPTT